MPIWFNSEIDHFKIINKRRLKNWISDCIASYQKETGTINYIFLDDKQLLEINIKYLNHDTLTDIVSFNYSDNKKISGDIFISVERVAENAKTFKQGFNQELKRVMVHGILHFIGFNDCSSEEKAIMRSKEEDALSDVKDLIITPS